MAIAYGSEMPPQEFDAIIATDFRFHGGTAESTLVEIKTQHAAGLRTGIYHLPSAVMPDSMPLHPAVAHALAEGWCELLNFAPRARAPMLLFRHPSVLADATAALPQ